MILCVAIGNTNTRCAFGTLDSHALAVQYTDNICCETSFVRFVEDSFGRDVWDKLSGCIISSVVPKKRGIITQALRSKGSMTIRGVCASNSSVSFSRYRGLLGEDRIACCTAAAKKHAGALVVVDLGTATTINVVDDKRRFLGGAILTGLQTGLFALTSRTAQLPAVSEFADVSLIGEDTSECLVSGALNGTAHMIEGFVARIAAQLGCEPVVIITGGNAPSILPLCDFQHIHEASLLLEGVFLHYEQK